MLNNDKIFSCFDYSPKEQEQVLSFFRARKKEGLDCYFYGRCVFDAIKGFSPIRPYAVLFTELSPPEFEHAESLPLDLCTSAKDISAFALEQMFSCYTLFYDPVDKVVVDPYDVSWRL